MRTEIKIGQSKGKIMNYDSRTGRLFPLDVDKYFSQNINSTIVTNVFYNSRKFWGDISSNPPIKRSKYLDREDLEEFNYNNETHNECEYNDSDYDEIDNWGNIESDTEFDEFDELNSNL